MRSSAACRCVCGVNSTALSDEEFYEQTMVNHLLSWLTDTYQHEEFLAEVATSSADHAAESSYMYRWLHLDANDTAAQTRMNRMLYDFSCAPGVVGECAATRSPSFVSFCNISWSVVMLQVVCQRLGLKLWFSHASTLMMRGARHSDSAFAARVTIVGSQCVCTCTTRRGGV